MDNKKKIILGFVALALAIVFVLSIRKIKVKKTGSFTGIDKNTIKMVDKDYLKKLTETQKANARILVQEMNKQGITNPFTQAGILAVISKESQFTPKTENLNYTAEQLQKVFKLDPATAATIQHKPDLIARAVYSPEHNKNLGNRNADDAAKYIGRGYNQITGYANYLNIGKKIGIDLVTHPEMLNDPKVAADAAIQFFKDGVHTLKNAHYEIHDQAGELVRSGSNRLSDLYNNGGDINDFKNELDAVGAMYNINAGAGASMEHINADVTGGRALALARVTALTELTKTA